MSRTITVPPLPWFNKETGEPTQQFRSAFEELLAGRATNSIGTVLSGVNTIKQSSIDEAAAAAENENAGSSAISISATPMSVTTASASSGNTTSPDVTISISGGVPPYTIAWSSFSGYAFTNNSPASLAADGDITVAFTAPAGDRYGSQKITVTDSAGTPVVQELTLSVNFFFVDGVGA